jgi:hypothetical protein
MKPGDLIGMNFNEVMINSLRMFVCSQVVPNFTHGDILAVVDWKGRRDSEDYYDLLGQIWDRVCPVTLTSRPSRHRRVDLDFLSSFICIYAEEPEAKSRLLRAKLVNARQEVHKLELELQDLEQTGDLPESLVNYLDSQGMVP